VQRRRTLACAAACAVAFLTYACGQVSLDVLDPEPKDDASRHDRNVESGRDATSDLTDSGGQPDAQCFVAVGPLCDGSPACSCCIPMGGSPVCTPLVRGGKSIEPRVRPEDEIEQAMHFE
jgi:hypothetical protein